MKTKLVKKLVLLALGVAAFASVSTSRAVSSSYLLTINDANPAAVVITATGNFPTASATTNTGTDGIDLLNFFTASSASVNGTASGGTLTAHGLTPAFNYYAADNKSSSASYFDLNLYVDNFTSGATNKENFVTSAAAFTGSWTLNLTGAALPTTGAQGSLMSGFSADSGAVIGQWQVVPAPEPGTVSIFAMGVLVVALSPLRRRYFSKK